MPSQMPRKKQCFKQKGVSDARGWREVQKDKDLDTSLPRGEQNCQRQQGGLLRVVGTEARLQWVEGLVAGEARR